MSLGVQLVSYKDNGEEGSNSPETAVPARSMTPANPEPMAVIVEPEPVVLCEVCALEERRYKCPRCGKLTCSLACCKEHKSMEGCSGKRDRTEFTRLSEFTTGQLRSDYLYLEDVLRKVDTAKRGRSGNNIKEAGGGKGQGTKKRKRGSQQQTSALKLGPVGAGESQGVAQPGGEWINNLTPALQKLVRHANVEGINLLLLPSHFAKRLANTTRFNQKKKTIFWQVEWVFKQASGGSGAESFTTTLNGISESTPLCEVLAQILQPQPGNAPTRNRLAKYCAAPASELTLFIQRLPRPCTSPLYCSLDPADGLAIALKGHTVIEYPTIYVALWEEVASYPTLVTEITDAQRRAAAALQAIPKEDGEVDASSDDESNAEHMLVEGGSSKTGVELAAEEFLAAMGEVESLDASQLKELGQFPI